MSRLNWERASASRRAGTDNRVVKSKKQVWGSRDAPGKQATGNAFAQRYGIACFECKRGPRDPDRRFHQVRWAKWGKKGKRKQPWIVCEDCLTAWKKTQDGADKEHVRPKEYKPRS